MNFEFRYYVFKNSELTKGERDVLEYVGTALNERRGFQGKEPLQGLFIEHDWPEFETIKDMIAARIEREQADA